MLIWFIWNSQLYAFIPYYAAIRDTRVDELAQYFKIVQKLPLVFLISNLKVYFSALNGPIAFQKHTIGHKCFALWLITHWTSEIDPGHFDSGKIALLYYRIYDYDTRQETTNFRNIEPGPLHIT